MNDPYLTENSKKVKLKKSRLHLTAELDFQK
jgi:hypothetical protein